MNVGSLDYNVPIEAQLTGGASGPVTFIALFNVPKVDERTLLQAWYGEEAFLVKQPGFISRELVRGRAGSNVFIDIAKWESAEHYGAALVHPEHQALLGAYGPCGGSSSLHLLEATTRPVELPARVEKLIQVINAGDTEGFLAHFDASRGLVVDVGRQFLGRDAIRAWNANEFIGAGGQVTPLSAEVSGDRVTVPVQWTSTAYTGPSKFVFTYKDDQLVELRLGP